MNWECVVGVRRWPHIPQSVAIRIEDPGLWHEYVGTPDNDEDNLNVGTFSGFSDDEGPQPGRRLDIPICGETKDAD